MRRIYSICKSTLRIAENIPLICSIPLPHFVFKNLTSLSPELWNSQASVQTWMNHMLGDFALRVCSPPRLSHVAEPQPHLEV
jgi:hypothetical protein